MKAVKPVRLPPVKCRSEEECRKIAESLRDAYTKGRRFRKVGFQQPKGK